MLHTFTLAHETKFETLLFPKRQILDSSKLEDFVDDNFKFDENNRKFSKCQIVL